MNKICLIFLKLSSLLCFLCSCSPETGAPLTRSLVPDYDKNSFEKPKWKEIQDPILQPNYSACEYYQHLNTLPTKEPYSLIKRLYQYDEGKHKANIQISNNPFFQFILGENFIAPNREEFYKMAEAEYEAGRLNSLEWYALKAAYKTNIGYDSLMYSSLNKKVEQNFPGIYGESSDLEGGLFEALLFKASHFNSSKIEPVDYSIYLRKKVPLFIDNSWESFEIDTLQSLSSAMYSFYDQSLSSTEEKQCAYLLLNRSFGQLLRIKGYHSPEIFVQEGQSFLKKLSADEQTQFKKTARLGSFLNSQNQSVLLSTENIANYKPWLELFSLNTNIQASEDLTKASLKDQIHFLSALTQFYSASSPARDWVSKSSQYLFGDISESNSAILPAEIQSLSLGLILMNFQNIAFQNIIKVNADSLPVQAGDKASGILFGEKDQTQENIHLSLKEIISFTEMIIHLDRSLDKLLDKSPEELKKLNSFYSKPTLLKLLGTKMFSEEEIREIIGNGNTFDPSSALAAQIQSLQLPLAYLIISMTKSQCLDSFDKNLSTGKLQQIRLCSKELEKQATRVQNMLAVHNNAPILWKPE